jgi:hypothetical protein
MALAAATWLNPSAWADTTSEAPNPLQRLLQSAGVAQADTAPDPLRLEASPTRARQLPLYKAIMAQPLQAPYRVGMLAEGYRQAGMSPARLMAMTTAVAGLAATGPSEQLLAQREAALRAAPDPLAASLAWMRSGAHKPWKPVLPSKARLPDPLRFELAMVLASVEHADQYLQRALQQLPATVTPALLRRQALDLDMHPFEQTDFRTLLPLLDRQALIAGMLDLTAAVERLQKFVASADHLPAVAWSMDTPLGQIVVDTTGRNNTYRLKDPLLVLDVGGDDVYEFLPPSDAHRISIVLDHGGNDRYRATAPGADPSAATLGYGILWDTQGDDDYQGTQHAQASALFGAALLVDGGGNNHFTASTHAQAQAIGGVALLVGSPGSDHYRAQANAQASAGPQGVAVLLEPGGDDHYLLDNAVLVRPAPQLPSVNTSMGQGAGYGLRPDGGDARSTTGGIGILFDRAGNDHYEAQVFAQGVGYHEGVGILVDDDGTNRFDAVWYAMGAAAHSGAGLLLKRGNDNDHYRASHSMALGAATDYSVGVFLDEGGDDHYELGDLGLGAAYDNSVALFVDAQGDDNYQVADFTCRAFGIAQIGKWGTLREDALNLGLFMDLGGTDSYPAYCQQAGNGRQWATQRRWPALKLRSEVGVGLDGEFALPFAIRPRTQ